MIEWSKKLKGLSEEEQVEQIKEFCKEHEISSQRQFKEDYRGGYEYFSKLSKKSRRKILPLLRNDWSFLKKLNEEELVNWFIEFKKEKI